MDGELKFDLVEKEEGIMLVWDKDFNSNTSKKMDYELKLRKEYKRLLKMRKTIWHFQSETNSDVPEYEWDMIWEYHTALVNALSYAINEMTGDKAENVPTVGTFSDGVCSVHECGNHYDDLEDEEDDLHYSDHTCDNNDIMKFPGYRTEETGTYVAMRD